MWGSAKPSVIHLRPAKPFEADFPLTIADRLVPGINSRYLFVYQAPKTNDWQDDLTQRLAKSLSSFLVEPEEGVLAIPQLCARIYSDSTGRLTARVNKESSLPFYVNHRNDITYESLKPEKGFPAELLDGKIFAYGPVNIPTPDKNGSLEGFTAQITYISGGFIICANKHHYLFDGNSYGQIISWWLRRARSYQNTTPPTSDVVLDPASRYMAIHDASSLHLKTNLPAQVHEDWKVVPHAKPHIFGLEVPSPGIRMIGKLLPFLAPKIVNAVFHFSAENLSRLHDETSAHAEQTFSKHDAVAALLWRCITRARMSTTDVTTNPPPPTSMLALATNGRTRIEPKMSPEYFGNVIFYTPTSLPIPLLVSHGSKTLSSVALSIRSSIVTKATNAHLRSLLQLLESQERVTDVVNSFRAFGGKDIMLTSWMGMFKSLEDLDVGVGTFQRMRLPEGGAFDGMGIVLPAFGRRDKSAAVAGEAAYEGGLEVSVDLMERDMDVLKGDGEWNKYTRWLGAAPEGFEV